MRFGQRHEPVLRRSKAIEVIAPPEIEKKYFDPETDISPSEWEEAKKLLGKLRGKKKKTGETDYLYLAGYLEVLSPGRIPEIQEDREMQEKYKAIFFDLRRQRKNPDAIYMANAYFTAYPTRIHELEIQERDWELTKKGLLANIHLIGGLGFAQEMENVAILFKDRFDRWEEKDKILEGVKKILDYCKEKEYMVSYIRLARFCKIAFGGKFQAEIGFSPDDEKKLKAELELCRSEKNWEAFFYAASTLYILSAEEVVVTNKGIEVHSRRKQLSKQVNLPERALA